MLKLSGVDVQYGNQKILHSIHLDINEGEIYVLMGPSGSGKTTLLRGIAGVVPFTNGSVFWTKEKAQTGLVFQEPRLFPHMTVLENIAFGLRARGIPKKARNDQVKEYLSVLQLDGLEARYPHQLSGGQQQRVSLGRVLVLKPDLLLLDEPFASLDAPLRVQLTEWLYTLQSRQQFSILWVTHYMDEAFSVADRVGLMMNGEILQEGTPLDFYQRPKSEKVASFFSLKNRFPREQWKKWGAVKEKGDMGWLPAGAIQLFNKQSDFISQKDCYMIIDGIVKRIKHEPKIQLIMVEVDGGRLEIELPIWEKAPAVDTQVAVGLPVDKIVWYSKRN
ncbi:ABC transporter ATP-binding protein [Bacillus sp. B15-48]|uniref:ABC transporter ATP-binding protein n=1 Tax=Bacillus sp. B15-48 TaxID=1548601 RepID=UPI00193EC28F|nr:ABC transporter ATP-binding protein [Bacillus sp. B15-48]MBM4762963.1 ATP-binding cassette domain-containing protein [Bacillus sp. B15-48]